MAALRTLLTSFFLAIGLAACGSAEEPWVAPGPTVGERFLAALALADQSGRRRSLTELHGERGTVLVFVRSADWCSYCMGQLADINTRLPEFRALGLSVVSVSVDPVEHVERFHRQREIGYVMLADPAGDTTRTLGIRDLHYPVGSRAHGVPQPVMFVVDRGGIVRAKFAERGYRKRPDLDRVLAELAQLELR